MHYQISFITLTSYESTGAMIGQDDIPDKQQTERGGLDIFVSSCSSISNI